jgi:guanyl-specific ribonuclease Sa
MRKVKLKNRIRLMALIVMALMVMLLAGCGKKPVDQPVQNPEEQPGLTAGSAAVESTSAAGTSSDAASDETSIVFSIPVESGSGEENATGEATVDLSSFIESSEETVSGSTSAESDEASAVTTAYTAHTEPLLDEDGTYTTKADVALYIHTYGKLPSNFMTKKQAKKLGWSGGSLEDFAPGMCIGGDYFGNYEGLLPEDKEYHECDIDTLGKKSRGAKRIIYSDDGYIYYTEDHYESFELLYEP